MSPSSCSKPIFFRSFLSFAVLTLAAGVGFGCGSSSSSPGGVANPVVDLTMQDSHCSGMPAQPVDPASCHISASDAGTAGDDGGADDGGSSAPEFGETMFNTAGNDDDCKYHVAYAVKPATDGNVTFTMTLTKLAAPGGPATGAVVDPQHGVSVQAFLDSDNTHVTPNTTPPTGASETAPGSGIYTITPVKLDRSGRWVVRFHYFETCDDAVPTSQHGHAAFFVDVP